MSSHQEPKDELERLIRESKTKSKKIVKKSSDLVQFGQHMTDLANASEKVMKYLPHSGIDWKPKIGSWSYANQQQDAILASMMPISMPTATTSGTVTAYSMTDFATADKVLGFVPLERQGEARVAVEQLSHVIDRLSVKDKVLSLLHEYGLSSAAPGEKSPAELFQTAHAAFEKPVMERDPAATSLIPMRECVNGTIAALLRRRPRQEPAKSQRDKILSICGQLAGSGVSQWAIESLARRWESLVDELSGSKKRDYSREDWAHCLRRASLFLLELLESLDPSRMKQHKGIQ